MPWYKGDEFIKIRGCFAPVDIGNGTHYWNGSKIVPKPKTKPQPKKRSKTNAEKQ